MESWGIDLRDWKFIIYCLVLAVISWIVLGKGYGEKVFLGIMMFGSLFDLAIKLIDDYYGEE